MAQPGRGAQKERRSWKRRLKAAGDIGGKPGESNGVEVTEVKTGVDGVQSCRGVKPDMDLHGHWISIRRPLTSSLGVISWAHESSRLNDECGRGHKPQFLKLMSLFLPKGNFIPKRAKP